MNERADICFTAGETASYVFVVNGIDGNPMDLTGYEVRSDVKLAPEYADPFLEIPVTVLNAGEGQVLWRIDAEKTAKMKNCQYFYDLLVTKNTITHRALQGRILVNLGVTR